MGSNSRSDIRRVAQRYGTMAAHTQRRASVLVMFIVYLLAHVQFCRFDKADATPTFSDTVVSDRHSDTIIFCSSEHTGCGCPGLLDRKSLLAAIFLLYLV